jgi:hypothetical protein
VVVAVVVVGGSSRQSRNGVGGHSHHPAEARALRRVETWRPLEERPQRRLDGAGWPDAPGPECSTRVVGCWMYGQCSGLASRMRVRYRGVLLLGEEGETSVRRVGPLDLCSSHAASGCVVLNRAPQSLWRLLPRYRAKM